jgi:hypothetical protein
MKDIIEEYFKENYQEIMDDVFNRYCDLCIEEVE